jgi:hypothetical protein
MRKAHLLVLRRPIPVTIAVLAVATVVSVAGWVQVSINRDIEARRRAIVLAEEEIENKRATMRRLIKLFVESGIFQRGAKSGASVFVGLAWVDWIAGRSLLGEDGPFLARQERLKALRGLRAHYQETGQHGTLTDALAAYSLAFTYLEAGDADAAEPCLTDAETGVLATLPEYDDMRQSLSTLRIVLDFERSIVAGDVVKSADLRRRLLQRQEEFLQIDVMHDLAYLIGLAIERHPA